MQEFLKARSIRLRIGTLSIALEDLSAILDQALYLNSRRKQEDSVLSKYAYDASTLCEARTKFKSKDNKSRWDIGTFASVSRECRFKECSDWHDRIYSLLSLFGDLEDFAVNYSLSKTQLVAALVQFAGPKPSLPINDILEGSIEALNISGLLLSRFSIDPEASRQKPNLLTFVHEEGRLTSQGATLLNEEDRVRTARSRWPNLITKPPNQCYSCSGAIFRALGWGKNFTGYEDWLEPFFAEDGPETNALLLFNVDVEMICGMAQMLNRKLKQTLNEPGQGTRFTLSVSPKAQDMYDFSHK